MELKQLTAMDEKLLAADFIEVNTKVGLIGGYCEPDFPIYYANEKMAAMLGYDSVADLIEGIHGKVANTIHPDDMAQVAKDLGDDYYEGMTYETTYRMPRKDGSWFWTVDRGKVVKAQDGRLAIISMCSDMSEFVKRQKELEAENNLSHSMLQTLPGGYHRCAVEEGFPFLFIGDRFLDILGWTREEIETLFDNKFLNLVHPEDKNLTTGYVERILQAALENPYQDQIYRLQGKDGWHWISDTTMLLHAGGTQFFQGFITDISHFIQEREKKEKELAAALERTERADAAKNDFLRRMSHDVRTPINGIRGIVEIAGHYPDDMEKQRDCREKVLKASGYLLALVSNVLDMNKLESGRMTLENKPFDLDDLLREFRTLVRMQAVERDVRCLFERGDDWPTHRNLIGSAVHLRQIIVNIAVNAIKYNKTGGQVTFRVREIPRDGDRVFLEFSSQDTGIGMTPTFLQHAFEPFSREYRKEGMQFSGTGLGLAIVKELVDLMGGELEVESLVDVGTTFRIRLPFAIDKEAAARESEAGSAVTLQGRRILLVEDNELNMEIAAFIFEREGVEVVKAWNGQEAVDAFAAAEPGTYDAIFMDIMMPVMGGLEASRRIRHLNRDDALSVPIFAMTANAFMDDIEQSLSAGMNEHLTKPLDTAKVIETLKRYVK